MLGKGSPPPLNTTEASLTPALSQISAGSYRLLLWGAPWNTPDHLSIHHPDPRLVTPLWSPPAPVSPQSEIPSCSSFPSRTLEEGTLLPLFKTILIYGRWTPRLHSSLASCGAFSQPPPYLSSSTSLPALPPPGASAHEGSTMNTLITSPCTSPSADLVPRSQGRCRPRWALCEGEDTAQSTGWAAGRWGGGLSTRLLVKRVHWGSFQCGREDISSALGALRDVRTLSRREAAWETVEFLRRQTPAQGQLPAEDAPGSVGAVEWRGPGLGNLPVPRPAANIAMSLSCPLAAHFAPWNPQLLELFGAEVTSDWMGVSWRNKDPCV